MSPADPPKFPAQEAPASAHAVCLRACDRSRVLGSARMTCALSGLCTRRRPHNIPSGEPQNVQRRHAPGRSRSRVRSRLLPAAVAGCGNAARYHGLACLAGMIDGADEQQWITISDPSDLTSCMLLPDSSQGLDFLCRRLHDGKRDSAPRQAVSASSDISRGAARRPESPPRAAQANAPTSPARCLRLS